MLKFLIIEDDKKLAEAIQSTVKELGATEIRYDGGEGLDEAQTGLYDLILLDIMLPTLTGYQILEKLRKTNETVPVLLLTAKDGVEDKVTGFKRGADDYLVKPFHREELLMRIKAILKRSIGLFQEDVLELGGLSCHLQQYQAYYEKEPLSLQGKEFDLLVYLVQNKNIILTKEQIFLRIWGYESNTTLSVVEVYMSRLRKSLKKVGIDTWIRTLRNVGYILEEK